MYCLSRYPFDTRNVCNVVTLMFLFPYTSGGVNIGSGSSVLVVYVGVQVVDSVGTGCDTVGVKVPWEGGCEGLAPPDGGVTCGGCTGGVPPPPCGGSGVGGVTTGGGVDTENEMI